MYVAVTINVDYDPTETSWEIVDDEENRIVERKGTGFYFERCREYTHAIELLYERSYTFTINDSFGDGMSKVCPASYSLTVVETNETLFFEEGFSFTFSRSHTFQVDQPPTLSPSNGPSVRRSSLAPTVSPTVSHLPSLVVESPTRKPTSVPSLRPSSRPSVAPSFTPSSLPTPSPTNVPSLQPTKTHKRRKVPFTLVLDFDQYPYETSWKIVPNIQMHNSTTSTFYRKTSSASASSHRRSVGMYGESFGQYKTPCIRQKIQLYLIEGLSYSFTIYDSKGNGMSDPCVTHGKVNDAGYHLYKGTIDDLQFLIWKGDGNSFTNVREESIHVPMFKDDVTIDDCTNTPSHSPSINTFTNITRSPSQSIISDLPTTTTINGKLEPLELLKVGAIGTSFVIAGTAVLIMLFVLVKMCTMRQKGKPVPHVRNHPYE